MEHGVDNKEPEFVALAGLKRVYEPARVSFGLAPKHPCPDCHCCQYCSDARCHTCQSGYAAVRSNARPKMSIREQIATYDRINCGENYPCLDPNSRPEHHCRNHYRAETLKRDESRIQSPNCP